jgi:hypothetical protein
VNTENFVVYNSSDWEAIEALNELFPQFQGVSAFALVIEAVDSVDRAALVIASK